MQDKFFPFSSARNIRVPFIEVDLAKAEGKIFSNLKALNLQDAEYKSLIADDLIAGDLKVWPQMPIPAHGIGIMEGLDELMTRRRTLQKTALHAAFYGLPLSQFKEAIMPRAQCNRDQGAIILKIVPSQPTPCTDEVPWTEQDILRNTATLLDAIAKQATFTIVSFQREISYPLITEAEAE